MPKNSEVFSSCTITVPPIFLIAFTPIAPSLPGAGKYHGDGALLVAAAAADSNSRSAEGRTKCTSSVCDSDSAAVGIHQQVAVRRRDVSACPAASASPSRACLTMQRGAPAEDLGHQAAVARVEVLHHHQRGGKIRAAGRRALR